MSESTDPIAFSFLRLTPAERIYCVEFATGKSHKDICKTLPYSPSTAELSRITRAKEKGEELDVPEVGVEPDVVTAWRTRDPVFNEAIEATLADPSWPIRNIVTPMLIAMTAKLELDYLYQRNNARPFKGVSPKTLELWMQLGGLFEQRAKPGGNLQQIVGTMQLVMPELRPAQSLVQGARPELVRIHQGSIVDDTDENVEREA